MSSTATDVAGVIQNEVNKRFDDFESSAKKRLTELEATFSTFELNLQREARERLKEVEEKVTKDFRTRMFAIILIGFVTAAGGLLVGTFTATKEVNDSVIALQKDIISAQGTIEASAKELTEKTSEVSAAKGALTEERSSLVAAQTELAPLLEQIRTTKTNTDRTLSTLNDAVRKTQELNARLQSDRAEYVRMKAEQTDRKLIPAKH